MAEREHNLNRLPSNFTVKQMELLETKLAALGSKKGQAALPKGPLPPAAKVRGVQRSVRRR